MTTAALTPTPRAALRSWRPWAVLAALAVAGAALAFVVGGLGSAGGRPMGAADTSKAGAAALVAVLREHGVDVRQADSLDAAAAAVTDPAETTLAWLDDGTLSPAQTARLSQLAGTVVALDPRWANGTIADDGNAARAIAALGQKPVLVWYLPSVDDLVAGGGTSIAQLVPPWLTPVALLLVAVVAAAAVWRGRRFGPLVAEPLPVVVRARETVEGRARLYQRSRERGHAADALRHGALARLARALGLPPAAGAEAVVLAAAAATGRRVDEVREALAGGEPPSDRALRDLAHAVAELEASVARSRR